MHIERYQGARANRLYGGSISLNWWRCSSDAAEGGVVGRLFREARSDCRSHPGVDGGCDDDAEWPHVLRPRRARRREGRLRDRIKQAAVRGYRARDWTCYTRGVAW